MAKTDWITAGRYLHDLRCSKGFSSARALSLAAGLSVNYVAVLERGDMLPRWGVIRKLSDTLELTAAERRKLWESVESARRPAEVRELLAAR